MLGAEFVKTCDNEFKKTHVLEQRLTNPLSRFVGHRLSAGRFLLCQEHEGNPGWWETSSVDPGGVWVPRGQHLIGRWLKQSSLLTEVI